MAAIAEPVRPAAQIPTGRRVWNAARIHVANPWPAAILPWIVLLGVHGLTWSIWALISHYAGGELDPDAFRYAGGVSWLVIYMMIVAIQAMNAGFRFAMGMSSTRRDYYAGTVAFFAAMALVYAVGLAILAAVERATDGWGLDGSFYAPAYLYDEPLAVVGFHYFALYLLFTSMGALIGALFVRWRAYGLYAYFAGLSLAVVALIWWALEAGDTLVAFFRDNPIAVVMAWTLPLSAVLAVLGWLVIRRAPVRG
ncbi:hypothetical protein [Demequina mangrovi]|uniref:ABC-2 type transport system permease protein n=1 Tax=Demequina mangrovi TaxID=1043493 RepID=A0A1H7B2K7_9MICO|nr:hypothetical protein [Demequina mangrovi]SEJ68480.1 hypothetical protein SAMN05421637_2682 [Demequina mangrovi]